MALLFLSTENIIYYQHNLKDGKWKTNKKASSLTNRRRSKPDQ